MSRAITRRNAASELGTGVRNVALSAAGGAALGAGAGAILHSPTTPVWPTATLNGASSGLGLATVGGLIVALVSPRYRNAGLATAGVGFGALVLTGIAVGVAGQS